MKESRFFICEHCGNLVAMINDAGVPLMCCGQKMTPIEADTVEASREKHIPVVAAEGDSVKVTVGSVLHPMTEEHSITWVYLETDRGGQLKRLAPNEAPEVCFTVCNERPVAVYAYCNLHGLWKGEL